MEHQLLLLALFFFLFHHSYSQLYDQEHAILLRLKQQWQDPPSLGDWNQSSSSHCTWPEIACTDNSVSGLFLVNTNITETIPPFICDLKNLTVIDLHLNYIPGTFPKVLYNCSKLQYLDLSQNYFVGAVPHDIDNLARLQFLSLGANNFSGDIPAAIGLLTELTNLQLYKNQFNGSFPPEIGNLSNLEVLNMATNGFVPSRFPSQFIQLKKLKILWLYESNLIGEIPDMIGEMVALESFDLSGNNLTGNLPTGLFMLKNLSILYLYKNQLSGEIPQVVEALNMSVIDLSQNNLSGMIPADFGKLEKLSELSLFSNQLSGEIPESIWKIPSLRILRLFTNKLSGALPTYLGQYSMLEEFQVAGNNLTGKLPDKLCHNRKLVGVVAFDNNFSGELPESVGNCSSLEIVMIFNNNFSGNIPSGLWTLFNLSSLMMSNNSFTGELPDKLSQNLTRLEISSNRFSGKIPAAVSSWRNLMVFSASDNLLSGMIPRELTALPRLITLSLDQNQLSNSLPSDIISWTSLTTLNLSRNQLSGQIPDEIGTLPSLSDLDLSENQFSGHIPPELGLLRPTSLNLSSNRLTGSIPSEFENAAYVNSFLNNSGLCASNPMLSLGVCNSDARKVSRKSSLSLPWILGTAIAVSALALLVSLFVIRVHRKRKHGVNSAWKLTSFQRLNFTESSILAGLTASNVIGSGGSGEVYRVDVNHSSNGVVAVKRIWTNTGSDEKLEKEFLAEIQILSTIRHSNIVRLLCCVSSNNMKLLVYEYLENRSLDRWLHRSNGSPNLSRSVHHAMLDWQKRLQIAVGAAQGLCYMHHDCSPPIVHRDIKSSNILLDSQFNAKIADFGLARMLVKQGEPATMSVVAGSFGYLAPEYARTTLLNEKIDVYSFGVILLELTTGKEANYGGEENSCLAVWAWRHVQQGKPIVDALDEEIKEASNIDDMSTIFRLGIMCAHQQPSARPSMKEVLDILIRCSRRFEFGNRPRNDQGESNAAPLLKNTKHDGHLASNNV
ncbi:hypothetical protein HS088_TW23G00759 [Tripterygium wilfordii]|uniref:Protein kinase domain-containing protein n=1 Tax=Tripterygium wilfordii TaxID=458696 RepID=A0A7J7BVW1_TRIWF|nr:receptor-like protein kinase HSL1 [Tripterygium wilfordii]KAF5726022.1 hypothetical protein HS088_TW23G00759 [Tripterygium wilfordii]